MPPLKKPGSLESMVMDYLVELVARFFDNLEENGPSKKFRRDLSDIKNNVRDEMRGIILTEFIRRFMGKVFFKLFDEEWSESTFAASLEMLMDIKIDGLECDGTIMKYLGLQDLRRLRGLTKIHLCYDRFNVPIILENCQLNDITSLLLYNQCEDQYLTVIGRNCFKLRVLRVPDTNITDKGLRALHPCKELRTVDIFDCDKVTHVGINVLISVHEKLEEFSYGKRDKAVDYCYFLYRMNKPCFTMKRFSIKAKLVSYLNLCLIVAMFPNLTDLGLNCEPIRDFSVLKSLSNLSGMNLEVTGSHSTRDFHSVWKGLQELIKLIGTNMTRLRFRSYNERCVMNPQGFQFLYEHCPNLESLKCDCTSSLVVPPFPKLKLLQILACDEDISFNVKQFGTMLSLEVLQLVMIHLSMDNLKSMVLDDKKFPKLKRFESVVQRGSKCQWDEDEINLIAKENNLDFIMKHCIVD